MLSNLVLSTFHTNLIQSPERQSNQGFPSSLVLFLCCSLSDVISAFGQVLLLCPHCYIQLVNPWDQGICFVSLSNSFLDVQSASSTQPVAWLYHCTEFDLV